MSPPAPRAYFYSNHHNPFLLKSDHTLFPYLEKPNGLLPPRNIQSLQGPSEWDCAHHRGLASYNTTLQPSGPSEFS